MKRLLMLLSVLAGWSLLGALAAGLYLILMPLERIRASMERIAMGVRAIEQETLPLGDYATTLAAGLTEAVGGAASATGHVKNVAGVLAPKGRGEG